MGQLVASNCRLKKRLKSISFNHFILESLNIKIATKINNKNLSIGEVMLLKDEEKEEELKKL